jgi:hypothetical protein
MICIARCVYRGLCFAFVGCLLAHPAVWFWRVSEKVTAFGKVLWFHQSSGFRDYEMFAIYLICSLWFWLFLIGMFAIGFVWPMLRGSHA